MNKCPHCSRKVAFKRFRCRVCHTFVWRAPHILFLILSGLLLLGAFVWLFDYFTRNKTNAAELFLSTL
ncbi:MAG: hypothetical protein WA584_15875 [Pyrinomonadaceae bacterium]